LIEPALVRVALEAERHVRPFGLLLLAEHLAEPPRDATLRTTADHRRGERTGREKRRDEDQAEKDQIHGSFVPVMPPLRARRGPDRNIRRAP